MDVFTALVDGPLEDDGNGTGTAWADYDGDGDLDLYLANDGQSSVLLRNDLPTGGSWLQIDLVGRVSNGSAIGARVKLWAGGGCQMRDVSGGSGYLSQDSPTLAFGLGSAVLADSIVVLWPSGVVERYVNLAANRRLTLTELDMVAVQKPIESAPSLVFATPSPNPCWREANFRFALPRTGWVHLTVYDVKGRHMATLVDQKLEMGWHALTWSGRDLGGRRVAAGVYVAKFEALNEARTRRVVWLP